MYKVSESAVQNSLEFMDFLKQHSIQDDHVMVSFDVKSLFMNIPTDLAVEVARRRLEEDTDLEKRTKMTVEEIVKLMSFWLNGTFFTFRGVIYSRSMAQQWDRQFHSQQQN